MKIAFLLVGLAAAAFGQENSSCSEGLTPSLTRFRNKLYEKIQMRAAEVPCSKIPKAQKISSKAWDNFKKCENQYIESRNKLAYKKCLNKCLKMVMKELMDLEREDNENNLDDNDCDD